MFDFDALKKPLLTKKDEEYQMLIEVAEENIRQDKEKSAQKKRGFPFEVVVREHLLRRGFNLTFNPNVTIEGSEIKNDLFFLKSTVNPNLKKYSPSEVNLVIEVKNNAGVDSAKSIKENFDALKKHSPDLRFAVVVLSEKTGYQHEVTDEKPGYQTYKSFTLVSRRIYPKTGGLYSPKAIMDMLKNKDLKRTGDWERFIAYLKAT
jgi:hypothetical protein